MDTCKVQDTRIVKPHVISRHGTVLKIMKLIRFVELIIFLNMVFSGSCSMWMISFDSSSDYDLMNMLISSRAFLTSPWFVFVAGNSILLVLFLTSQGCFSGEENRTTADFYDEYIEKCRRNHHQLRSEQIRSKAYHAKETFRRSRSEGIITRALHENNNNSHRFPYNTMSAKDMSGEDFRDMVEAFIARQQRFLIEEKECSS